MRTVFLLARVVFGAWLLASGLNHFFLAMWPEPAGTQPLAIQLMTALNDSRLIDVTYGIQLVAGALILSGLFVPFALCAAMPVSVGAALGLLAVALNALLMFAYLEYYQGVLQRHSLSYGESQGGAR
jgi:uncharacterized membrane protein YphA (DoxX/SURF4 family)